FHVTGVQTCALPIYGTYVFRTLTTVQSYDILSTLKYNEEISKDDFISYIDEGSFDTPADVIFNMPLFSREQDMYRIKRREEEFRSEERRVGKECRTW